MVHRIIYHCRMCATYYTWGSTPDAPKLMVATVHETGPDAVPKQVVHFCESIPNCMGMADFVGCIP